MRILIAAVGPPHHDTSLSVGLLMAKRLDAVPTIITVIKDEDAGNRAKAFHDQTLASIKKWCAHADCVIRVGDPGEEIVEYSFAASIDLIVVGASGSINPLQRGVGTTATWVVAHAPCPVAVAKAEMPDLRRLLLCVSAAENPDLSGETLTKMIARAAPSMEITVLHVMSHIMAAPGALSHWQLDADANTLILEHTPEGKRIQKDVGILISSGAKVFPKVRHGLVVDEILAESKVGSYDLIIIGANQNRGWKRFLLDNLEHRIAAQSELSIMIL